jgi:hypothetical protein
VLKGLTAQLSGSLLLCLDVSIFHKYVVIPTIICSALLLITFL